MRLFFVLILLLTPALADVNLASDFALYGRDSTFSTYSEGVDHKVSASSTGPVEYSMAAELPSAGNSTVFSGINATTPKTVASFMARTPEYDLSIKKATNLYATARLGREREVEFVEEIITEVTNDSLVQTTEVIHTTSTADVVARGNGSLEEDVYMAYSGKARRLNLRELSAEGNFSLNTSLVMNGKQTMESFQVLNEPTKAFDKVIPPEEDSSMKV